MTKTSLQEPKGARLSSAAGKDSDAPRREGLAQPHPDDWPPDLVPENRRAEAESQRQEAESPAEEAHPAEVVQPSPEHPVPGDAMQAYSLEAEEGRPAEAAAPAAAPQAPQDTGAREAQGAPSGATEAGPAEAVHSHAAAAAGPRPAAHDNDPLIYPAEGVRQGRIVLDQPEKRALFVGGLVGLGIVALALAIIEASV